MRDDAAAPADPTCDIPLTEVEIQDIFTAMSQSEGYLDITPGDALALYRLAYRHASARVGRERTVGTVMTSPAHTASPELPGPELARLMASLGVSGLPVLKNDALIGVVSIKDFLPRLGLPKQATPMALVAALLEGGLPSASLAHLTTRDLMTAPAQSVPPSCPVAEAAQLMDRRRINRLPVVEGGRLVGIITRDDIVRAWRPEAAPE